MAVRSRELRADDSRVKSARSRRLARTSHSRPWNLKNSTGTSLWLARHPEFNRRQQAPVYLSKRFLFLRCSNEYRSGQATFERVDSQWKCVLADSSISFLLGKDAVSAKMQLVKRGFSWQWEAPGLSGTPGNKSQSTTAKDAAPHRGLPIVADGGSVNRAAGGIPEQASSPGSVGAVIVRDGIDSRWVT